MARSRRMLANDIVTSDEFLKMSGDVQALYFHLNIQADDDGFVAPLKVIRMVGASDDSIKILKAKRFVIPFESGVVVIRHWRHHNSIRVDRYQPTSYLEEKRTLSLDGSTYNVVEHGNQVATIGRASKEVSKEVKGEFSKENGEGENAAKSGDGMKRIGDFVRQNLPPSKKTPHQISK